MLKGKTIVIIGHPLAAEENRLPFSHFDGAYNHLIIPLVWKARSAGVEFRHDSAITSNGPSISCRIHALPIVFSGSNTFFFWQGLGPLLHRLRPHLVYNWEEAWCLSAFQISRICRALSIPHVFYAAENREKKLPWPLSVASRGVLRHSSAAFAISEEAKTRLRERGFHRRIFRIPLPIQSFPYVGADKNARLLVYIGRLIPLKRVALLVRALEFLPGWRLRLVGDGPERENLENLAVERRVSDRIEFTGHIPNHALAEAFRGATLTCVPTGGNSRQAEQFGKAALESVACGIPVLASTGGNYSLLAEEFDTVFARTLNSAEELAIAVEDIGADFPTQERLEASRNRVLSHYSPKAVGNLMSKAVAAVLDAKERHAQE